MPAKTEDSYQYSYDWSDVEKKLKFGKNCGLTSLQLKVSADFDFSFEMKGDKRMSPRQRNILTRLNDGHVKNLKEKTQKEIQERLDKLEKDAVATQSDAKVLPRDRPGVIRQEANKASQQIEHLVKAGDAKIHDAIDRNIAGYVKGKHHKRKKVQQTVKHVVKVPLAVAAVPLGIVLSAGVVTTPIGVIILSKASGSITQAYNYTRNHKMGLIGISKRIKKNLDFVEAQSDAMAIHAQVLADPKASPSDLKKAEKALRKSRSDMLEQEVISYAFETFLSQHSKSIQNLSGLVDKYRKKLNKYKFGVISIGRKIDKMEDAIAMVNKRIDKRKIEMKAYPKLLADAGLKPKEIQKHLDKMVKKNEECAAQIVDIKKNIKFFESIVDDEIALCIKRDNALDVFTTKLENFKSLRPKAIHHWKKAIKSIAFIDMVASAAFGETDAATPIMKAPEILEGIGNNLGRIDDATDAIQDTWGHATKAWDKLH